MPALWERMANRAPLVRAARRSGIPFEASPTGRWVRIAGRQGVVYVVQDAWGDGCLLMGVGDPHSAVEHFLSPDLAVAAASRQTGVLGGWQASGGAPLAEAG